jgi:predicted TIM-barrel fold metal-dependent hydrolase
MLRLSFGIGVLFATCVGVLACGSNTRGVEYAGTRLAVVDMHLHPGEFSSLPEDTQRFVGSRLPFPLSLNPGPSAQGTITAEGILSEMDRAGVTQSVLFAVYAPRSVGITTNERVLSDMSKNPERFFGLASLRLDRWETERDNELLQLRKALSQPGMIGIKLAHAHQHFRFDDARYFPIYVLAGELKKPVYLHTGSSPFINTAQEKPYTDPAYVEEAIQQHPTTKFILGHLGYDFTARKHDALETCIRLAKTYPNVFLEPSALGSRGSDPTSQNLKIAFQKMKEAGVVDRIIYGSDGPQSPGFVREYLQRTVEAMKAAEYTADEASAVLSGNFARAFEVKRVSL